MHVILWCSMFIKFLLDYEILQYHKQTPIVFNLIMILYMPPTFAESLSWIFLIQFYPWPFGRAYAWKNFVFESLIPMLQSGQPWSLMPHFFPQQTGHITKVSTTPLYQIGPTLFKQLMDIKVSVPVAPESHAFLITPSLIALEGISQQLIKDYLSNS